jgi:2-polyprenyl-3-methyl-5-hydroxy-6-metoxy-1,4-benzoquinol methylase
MTTITNVDNSFLIDLIEQYMNGSDHPDLKGYREQTYTRDFADKDRFVWSLKHIAKLGDYRSRRILDVGCGCGWQAFTISLLDTGNSIVGLDILPSMIEGMSECVVSMKEKGTVFNLIPMCGDICDSNLDLNQDSFDAIYSLEAIEHVHDMTRMLERCYALLKPKGNLILGNDANILHPKTRREVTNMWLKRENSWEWCDYLKSIRSIEHGNAKPFSIMREEVVIDAVPELPGHTVERVVGATAGLMKPEIEKVALEHFRNGIPLRERPMLDWCRNPLTGEYAERLFDPFALAEMMRATGFENVEVRHFFRRFPLRLCNGIQFRPLSRVLFKIRPPFLLYGEKR